MLWVWHSPIYFTTHQNETFRGFQQKKVIVVFALFSGTFSQFPNLWQIPCGGDKKNSVRRRSRKGERGKRRRRENEDGTNPVGAHLLLLLPPRLLIYAHTNEDGLFGKPWVANLEKRKRRVSPTLFACCLLKNFSSVRPSARIRIRCETKDNSGFLLLPLAEGEGGEMATKEASAPNTDQRKTRVFPPEKKINSYLFFFPRREDECF